MKKTIAALALLTAVILEGCATRAVAAPAVAPRRVFVEGRWVVAPSPRAVWVPAHWETRGFHRVWIAGHWR